MKKTIVISLFAILAFIYVRSQNISLKTRITQQQNDTYLIWMNCTTDVSPLANTADFLLNKQTIASVGYDNYTCHVRRQECEIKECNCTQYSYVLSFKKTLQMQKNRLTCKMHFKNTGKIGYQLVSRTVIYDGLDIIDIDEETIRDGLTNNTNVNVNVTSSTKDVSETSYLWLYILIGTTVPLVVVILVVVLCRRKDICNLLRRSERKNQKKETKLILTRAEPIGESKEEDGKTTTTIETKRGDNEESSLLEKEDFQKEGFLEVPYHVDASNSFVPTDTLQHALSVSGRNSVMTSTSDLSGSVNKS